jgi:hypothetical protein
LDGGHVQKGAKNKYLNRFRSKWRQAQDFFHSKRREGREQRLKTNPYETVCRESNCKRTCADSTLRHGGPAC